jgi:DNA-binding MarR family transcriptional regulator/GNAT superfamily N-acetyltransferase
MTARASPQRIAALRRFNRFYTRQIGVLRRTYLDSGFALGELRVLYEIGHGDAPTATEIARALDFDPGYLSRILRDFEKRRLIARRISAADARQSHLTLTGYGRRVFAPLERRTQQQAGVMLGRLSAAEQARLVAAMTTIEGLIERPPDTAPAGGGNYILRAPKPGDFGWMVARHAELYAKEYGWIAPFEGLCAQIVADFANDNDPQRERCWIAEIDGENVGCVMLVKDKAEIARIRLLLVEPKARGLGLGARLIDECVRFARRAGYKKITLWTHSVLTAARHIYQKAGFKLMRSEEHRSWSQPVVSEHWDLEL